MGNPHTGVFTLSESKLTVVEEELFKMARSGNYDPFTQYFFVLPKSGTRYTIEDRVERWKALRKVWEALGKPDKFTVTLEGKEAEILVEWDEYYNGEPVFLHRHGYRFLDWARQFIDLRVKRAIAITGTGAGKTSSVAIAGLMYCALYPGFRFLNAAPSQAQANLMLEEIRKWVGNGRFRKFIVGSKRSGEMWTYKPHPTITVVVEDGHPSTFVVQTIDKDGSGLLGGEHDWLNVEEAQVVDVDAVRAKASTRLRGTRSTGEVRSSKLTWITNPGQNIGLSLLVEKYLQRIEEGDKSHVVLEGVDSSVNVYTTKRQLDLQRSDMTEADIVRWHEGSSSMLYEDALLGSELADRCLDEEIDQWCQAHSGKEAHYHPDFGLDYYMMPREAGHTYITVGDVGRGIRRTIHTNDIPVVATFDVTEIERSKEFRRIPMVAFWWQDGIDPVTGKKTYRRFVGEMTKQMLHYRSAGWYDATNVRTAFEDFDGAFKGLPTTPVFINPTNQKVAVTMIQLMMQDGVVRVPYIKALWHQFKVYRLHAQRVPDDIVAALQVLMISFYEEDVYWNKIVEQYKVLKDDDDEEENEQVITVDLTADPFATLGVWSSL